VVVIVAERGDVCAQRTAEAIVHLNGSPPVFIDTASPAVGLRLAWRAPGANGTVGFNGQEVAIGEITGVFYRVGRSASDFSLDASDRRFVEGEISGALISLFTALPCPVVNSPLALATRILPFGSPKMRAQISALGFQTPDVLVTSDVEEGRLFFERSYQGALLRLARSLSAVRLPVGMVGIQRIADGIVDGPVMIVREPRGCCLQLFVVGERVISVVEDGSGALVTAVPPSNMLCRRLVSLTHVFQYDFAFVRLTGDVVLDVNPLPPAEACDEGLQGELAVLLAMHLAGGDNWWRRT
jgi:hypothetical protein